MSPPPRNFTLPLLHKFKETYLIWFNYYTELPKPHRYTLGLRLDNLFVETIENIAIAKFTPTTAKLPFIITAISKLDLVNLLLTILWETKSLEPQHYLELAKKLDDIGKMLTSWKNSLATPMTLPALTGRGFERKLKTSLSST